jgi:HTH-type transcriptional regulator/antitoxin HigA
MRTKTRRRVVPDVASHPGEHIADTIAELKISQAELARRMGRPQPAINQIVRGAKAVTAETALQLEAALGISAETWMNLQTNYDLVQARQTARRRKAG